MERNYTFYYVSEYKHGSIIFAQDSLKKAIDSYFLINFKKDNNGKFLISKKDKKKKDIYIYKIECVKFSKTKQSYSTGIEETKYMINKNDVKSITEFKKFDSIESFSKYANIKISDK